MSDDADPAALAFDALRAEVALLRHALEGFSAASERAQTPDYSPLLGRVSVRLEGLDARIGALAAAPALAMTPQGLADRLEAATGRAQRAAETQWSKAQTGLEAAVRDLDAIVIRPRAAFVQDRWLAIAFGVGLVVGALLWAAWSGPVSRGLVGHRHLEPAPAAGSGVSP